MTSPLVFPPNDVWAPFAEIPYWLRVTSASDWSCHERNLLRPIRSITQIWVVNVNGMKFLQSLLRRHFAGRQVVASWNASLRGRHLEVVGEREIGRARGRRACLHLARPFFLCPLLSSACYAGYEMPADYSELNLYLSVFTSVSNKWIHEHGNEFTRPCSLSPDE